jgi:hypothetical protein
VLPLVAQMDTQDATATPSYLGDGAGAWAWWPTREKDTRCAREVAVRCCVVRGLRAYFEGSIIDSFIASGL